MKILCTLDYIDGRQSVTVTRDIEQVDATYIRMLLCSKDVCGITLTRVRPLGQLAKSLNEEQEAT